MRGNLDTITDFVPQSSLEQLVDYLNNYFAVQTWNAAADLIGNLAISQTDAAIRDRR